jgi:hypothetical protein
VEDGELAHKPRGSGSIESIRRCRTGLSKIRVKSKLKKKTKKKPTAGLELIN